MKKDTERKKSHWISIAYWVVGGLAVIALAYSAVMHSNPLITLATGIALVILYSLLIKRYKKKK
jgi:4-hydroxybenzoate polyprenyltransferase